MHTGMVQPAGPSSHFWIIFGSVCARYTASGGAAKRRVTTMCVSPSVLSVIFVVIVILFIVSSSLYLVPFLCLVSFLCPFLCLIPWRPELHPAGRNSFPELRGAWPATGPSRQCRPWPIGEGAWRRRLAGQ